MKELERGNTLLKTLNQLSEDYRQMLLNAEKAKKALKEAIDETRETIYLDYVNNFNTVEKFAEYYEFDVEYAKAFLRMEKAKQL